MKISFITIIMLLNLMLISSSFASAGNSSGGGGDASELRVDEIRSDILKWIMEDGAKSLIFPRDLSYNEYKIRMTTILALKKVVVSFVDKNENDELRVVVGGEPKTCRGYISELDLRPHIICNISRFKKTSEAGQYKLIHHEFAGLVGVENNDGAASDYSVSSQITDFLTFQKVLRLAVKKDLSSSDLADTKKETWTCKDVGKIDRSIEELKIIVDNSQNKSSGTLKDSRSGQVNLTIQQNNNKSEQMLYQLWGKAGARDYQIFSIQLMRNLPDQYAYGDEQKGQAIIVIDGFEDGAGERSWVELLGCTVEVVQVN